jgi:hypothetical protein
MVTNQQLASRPLVVTAANRHDFVMAAMLHHWHHVKHHHQASPGIMMMS